MSIYAGATMTDELRKPNVSIDTLAALTRLYRLSRQELVDQPTTALSRQELLDELLGKAVR